MLDKTFKIALLTALPILLWISLGVRNSGRYAYHSDADNKQFTVFDTWTGTVFQTGDKGVLELQMTTGKLIQHAVK